MNLIQEELAYYRAAAPELEAFLLSAQAAWPLNLPAGAPVTQLTLGNFLVSRAVVRAAALAGVDWAQLDEPARATLARWQSNAARRAENELPGVLQRWMARMQEWREHPVGFERDLRLRFLLGELAQSAPGLEAQSRATDERLRALTQPGPFVWDAPLAEGLPEERFWYLYRRLK